MFKTILDILLSKYAERVADVSIIIKNMIKHGLINASDDIENDHIAFRTLGVKYLGIQSLEKVFIHYGFEAKDNYSFSEKKLNATWYSPPDPSFPRIFISELRVNELSKEAQNIIYKYTSSVKSDPVDTLNLADAEKVGHFLHSPLWDIPYLHEYETLAKESEYAAWVIYNRYYLNHFTISVHNLLVKNSIEEFSDFVESLGIELNSSGGKIKISSDGLLKQSSTKSKLMKAKFREENNKKIYHNISGSYVEFAERLPLEKYKHLDKKCLQREHIRDGFEAKNADKIFESTYKNTN